jgi:hypothetical protein
MKSTTCPGDDQRARAARGELGGEHLASFEVHAAECSRCAAALSERAAIAALREAAPPRMDPFTERRLRAAIVDPARPESRVVARRRPSRAVAALGALAVAAAIGGIFVLARSRPVESVAPSASTEAEPPGLSLTITTQEGAAPRRETKDGVERVTVGPGRYGFDVHRHAGDARLVVQTPDGEIEDIGTVFEIVVDGARTTRIHVARGAVVFRRAGQPEVRLEAGSTYEAALHAARAPELEPSAPSAPPTAAGASSAPVARVAATDAAPGAPPVRPTESAAPTDRDAEDDAYMRVVALVREGRAEEARVAARDYLRRFPDGFRRIEVARLAE